MNWIFDHFEIVIIVALGFASWLKSRMDARRAADDLDQQPGGEMAEAEGQERPPVPPVPPWPRRPFLAPPLLWQTPDLPPPLTVAVEDAAMLKRQNDLQEKLQQIRATPKSAATKAFTTGGAAATRSRVLAAQSHGQSALLVADGLADRLRDGKEVRRAVVMREILGPPLGLR